MQLERTFAPLSSRLVPPPPGDAPPFNLSIFVGKRLEQLRIGSVGASQFAQDRWVDTWLGGLRGGLVVESGAFDAEQFSNSLFFEVARGWNCLLVEPNPSLQTRLLAVRRRCHVLRGGLSPTGKPSSFRFRMEGSLGGIDDRQSEDTQVPCYPLYHVLRAAGLSTTINFWSLDTEGSEPDILNTTRFGIHESGVEVGILAVEHRASTRAALHTILLARGFERVSCHDTDDFYANREFHVRHGLPLPNYSRQPSIKSTDALVYGEMRKGRFRHMPCPRS